MIFRGGAIDLDAHLAGARLGAGIAHRVLLRDGTFSLDRAGDGQNAFEQRGLAAAVRTHQGHCAWPPTSILFGHERLHRTQIRVRGAGARFPLWAASAPLQAPMLARNAGCRARGLTDLNSAIRAELLRGRCRWRSPRPLATHSSAMAARAIRSACGDPFPACARNHSASSWARAALDFVMAVTPIGRTELRPELRAPESSGFHLREVTYAIDNIPVWVYRRELNGKSENHPRVAQCIRRSGLSRCRRTPSQNAAGDGTERADEGPQAPPDRDCEAARHSRSPRFRRW